MRGPLGGGGLGAAAAPAVYDWSTDPQTMAWFRPDSVYANRVTNQPAWPALAEIGGAVARSSSAGPQGTPAYMPAIATGGILKTTTTTLFSGPFRIIVVAKILDASPVFSTFIASQVGNGADLSYLPGTGIIAESGSAIVQNVDAAASFHIIDGLFWGGTFGGLSLNGADFVGGSIEGAGLQGFNVAAFSDGSRRCTAAISDIIICEGPGTPAWDASLYAYLQTRYALNTRAPAPTNKHTVAAPAWNSSAPWDAFPVAGQSNCQGLGENAATAFGANIYSLGYDFIWKAATDPITSATPHTREPVDNGNVVASHAGHVGFGNAMQPHRGKPLAFIPIGAGGSYVVPAVAPGSALGWDPTYPRGLELEDSLFGSWLNRCLEAQFWGGTIPAAMWHQGESEAQSQDAAVQDQWVPRTQAMFDRLRHLLGIPNLPIWYVQIQPLITDVFWTRFRTVVQPQLQSANQFMVAAPDGPYRSDASTSHLHLQTSALEVLYANIATSMIAHGI